MPVHHAMDVALANKFKITSTACRSIGFIPSLLVRVLAKYNGHTASEKDTNQIVPLSGCWSQAEVLARH
jgi:hypothetical protein